MFAFAFRRLSGARRWISTLPRATEVTSDSDALEYSGTDFFYRTSNSKLRSVEVSHTAGRKSENNR